GHMLVADALSGSCPSGRSPFVTRSDPTANARLGGRRPMSKLTLTLRNETASKAWNPTWTLVAASLALTMAFLDALVVTTALPTLRSSLHSNLADLEWTVNAYNLAFACMLLTGAALGDRFGRRRMFCVGLSLFLIASLIAGSASTVNVL